jgi:hypothetical protein
VSSGVLQGDPASSLFFALVLSPALKAAAAALKDGLLFAYIDDVTIAGPADQVAAAFTAFESFLAEPGLRINAAKSFIYALEFPNPSTLPQQLQQFTPSPEGIIVLGTPIGNPAFEKNFCMEKAAETAERVGQILTMKSKHAHYILCRDSANETIIHLSCSATSLTPPPDITLPSTQHFNHILPSVNSTNNLRHQP